MNGDWAVWTQSVNGTRFNVWRYQISTRTTTLVPNPANKVHSAAAVNPNGTVYFEQSGPACGSGVTIEVFPVGGPVTAAGTLPAGSTSSTRSCTSTARPTTSCSPASTAGRGRSMCTGRRLRDAPVLAPAPVSANPRRRAPRRRVAATRPAN